MARTDLTVTTALGPYGDYTAANVADLDMDAADPSNKNQYTPSSRDLVIAHNTGGSAYTITITSAADPTYGRTGDIDSYSLGAGEYAVFGPFVRAGWVQSDGYVYLEASNALVLFGVIALPA